jgi:hypothetical protein
VVAAVKRRSRRKRGAADADGRAWIAGALIMAAAYVLPTPPRAVQSTRDNDEGARTDAPSPHEACAGGVRAE